MDVQVRPHALTAGHDVFLFEYVASTAQRVRVAMVQCYWPQVRCRYH